MAYVSYKRTISRNYQSESSEFGLDVEQDGKVMARARKLCRAMVNADLGHAIGLKRRELDRLANEFLECSWHEAQSGVDKEDEEL